MLFLAFTVLTIQWSDLSAEGQRLAIELGWSPERFPAAIQSIRTRNADRLRMGELDHLVFYLLQSKEFTTDPPIEPARAALDPQLKDAVERRVSELLNALKAPSTDRQKYFSTLLPADPERLLRSELERTLHWIRTKEVACRTASSPQACIAASYVDRGHSSDTQPRSMASVRAAFEWLDAN
ncbi:MAG TPA: hypothetical protein VE621_19035, partial [Bryobacteraceae bacterium]|nr:hypothetical protein [Bryobacteraceae bacterium]